MFTDGACRGNPGPGGWGVLLRASGREWEINGGEANTTNNRMELLAAIRGLEELEPKSLVSLTTDSQYVRKGITQWIAGWKSKGWKTTSKKPVKNQDLWQQLDKLTAMHDIDWHWVKGHSGHAENERADTLANQAIDTMAAQGAQDVKSPR